MLSPFDPIAELAEWRPKSGVIAWRKMPLPAVYYDDPEILLDDDSMDALEIAMIKVLKFELD